MDRGGCPRPPLLLRDYMSYNSRCLTTARPPWPSQPHKIGIKTDAMMGFGMVSSMMMMMSNLLP